MQWTRLVEKYRVNFGVRHWGDYQCAGHQRILNKFLLQETGIKHIGSDKLLYLSAHDVEQTQATMNRLRKKKVLTRLYEMV
jgi:hypothetical protein